ncbi:MAG: hypothetical protein O9264_02370 [Leptospira sp.]|nr:hypothetical protein [Leptospira sp.]
MKRITSFTIIISLLGLITMQCATSAIVNIDTQPVGAELYYKGNSMGKTPTSIEMGTSIFSESTLVFKNGDQTIATEKVQRRLSVPMLVFNIFLGWFTLGISWFWVAPPKEYQHFIIGNVSTKGFVSSSSGAVTGFTDTVTLKNGTKYEGCSAAVTADSVVITTKNGKTLVYRKSEVQSFKKGN